MSKLQERLDERDPLKSAIVKNRMFFAKKLYDATKHLTKEEIDKLYSEASISNPGKTRKQLEEILAEDFADYKSTGKILKNNPTRNTFFRRIINAIKDFFGMKATKIQQVYERLDQGFYNGRVMVNNKEFSSLNRSESVKRFT